MPTGHAPKVRVQAALLPLARASTETGCGSEISISNPQVGHKNSPACFATAGTVRNLRRHFGHVTSMICTNGTTLLSPASCLRPCNNLNFITRSDQQHSGGNQPLAIRKNTGLIPLARRNRQEFGKWEASDWFSPREQAARRLFRKPLSCNRNSSRDKGRTGVIALVHGARTITCPQKQIAP
jgi:hypothetical protein